MLIGVNMLNFLLILIKEKFEFVYQKNGLKIVNVVFRYVNIL